MHIQCHFYFIKDVNLYFDYEENILDNFTIIVNKYANISRFESIASLTTIQIMEEMEKDNLAIHYYSRKDG